jgi:hypothetical protein
MLGDAGFESHRATTFGSAGCGSRAGQPHSGNLVPSSFAPPAGLFDIAAAPRFPAGGSTPGPAGEEFACR